MRRRYVRENFEEGEVFQVLLEVDGDKASCPDGLNFALYQNGMEVSYGRFHENANRILLIG